MRRHACFTFLLFCFFTVNGQLRVQHYTPANGLLDSRVIKMFQDNRGLMYFLTWEGISIFDGQRFENITEYQGTSLGLVNDIVQWKNDTCYVFTFQRGAYKLINGKIIVDTAFNRVVEINHVVKMDENNWIVSTNKGLFKWNGSRCTRLLSQTTPGSSNSVDYIAIAGNRLICIEANGLRLKLLNLTNNLIEDSLVAGKTIEIKQGKQQDFFIKINDSWEQLNYESLINGKLKRVPLYFSALLPAGFNVNKLCDARDKIWLENYSKGYLLLNPKTGEKELYSTESGLSNFVSNIFTDKENNYWFIFFGKEVQKLYQTKFKAIDPNRATTGLIYDENQNVYARSRQQVSLLQQNKIASTQGAVSENSFFWQGRQWFFKTKTVLHSDRGNIIELPRELNDDRILINRIQFDKEGRLIICGSYLIVIEKNFTFHITPLPYFTDNIAIDDNNTYWAFARSGGIYSYSTKDNKIFQNSDTFLLSYLSPRFALHWNEDTFCVSTRHLGIIWMTLKKFKHKEVGRLNTARGLSNNFASCLARRNNTLYAATQFGLDEIKFYGKDTTIQNLSAANNLFLPFDNVVKSNTGEIFALSNDNQLWAVMDSVASKTDFIPSAWFNEITVNGEAQDAGVNKFSYTDNNFRFTVVAPCFTNAGGIRYQFLLQSESNTWQQQSTDNFYSINNLSPGQYNLDVTVSYPGKMYPDKKISYSFIIHSPLWKRWWFIGLCIAAAALIFWAILRTYYNRKLALQKAEAEKQQALDLERNRISRDMHDDMGSGLTKIAIMSEVAKKQLPEPLKAKEQLEKISESSRELVDSLQDIIWVLNPENDNLESLAAYIREYALKYFEPFAVNVLFNYPNLFSAIKLSEEKRRNVYLAVKESLNNIAKHAWCNNVTISIKESAGYIEINIQDDGKGFDMAAVRPFANGLKNMRTRIEQSGGVYKIGSVPGVGTSTDITMPV